MKIVEVKAPYGKFRKSLDRSYGATYEFVPPSTFYGFLLSLVGEYVRERHEGVRLAFAYASKPRISVSIKKRSRYKYGVAGHQETLGNVIDYVETLCGICVTCWIDSSEELNQEETLEERVEETLLRPKYASRSGPLYLGSSDDMLKEVNLIQSPKGELHRLRLDQWGLYELPVWVDHLGSKGTRWTNFDFDRVACDVSKGPGAEWEYTVIAR